MTDPVTSALADNADDLLRYFRRRVGDDAAPDLLAETLTTAWRRIRVLPDEPEDARAWLFRTANNVLLNHRRSERRQSRLADRVRTVLASTEQVAGADAGLEVRDAIDRLDPKLAEVVRLVHWEGFTIAQASVVLDIAASTARNHYAQAKQQLRAALKEPVLR